MKRIPLAFFLVGFLGIAAAAQPQTAQLKVGDMAPDFTLTDTAGQKVKLSDLRGKNNVVLAFYVFAFTGG
jgi:cytochrome oxidase Cu insertion factor (SCO1/SenC/PrrC family)